MEPRKQAIMAALDRFVAQRPGLEFGNYGDVRAYRSEMRSITRDRHDYNALARAVERSDSITADMLLKASESAFSGRLTISADEIHDNQVAAARKRGAVCYALADSMRHVCIDIDYVTGQYFPTEYRKAACAVLASVLWESQRASINTPANIEASHQIGSPSIGDMLRARFRREFGRGLAGRYFQ